MPITVFDGCHPYGSHTIRTVKTTESEELDSCKWYPSDTAIGMIINKYNTSYAINTVHSTHCNAYICM